VGAMRRVRYEDFGAPLPTLLVVRTDHHHARELPLRSRRRLERYPVHPADLGQVLLEVMEEVEKTLRQCHRLEGMGAREAGKRSHRFVELRVVFHGARSEGIEAEVDGVVPSGDARKVADHIHLGEFRQTLAIRAQKRRGELVLGSDRRYIEGRERIAHASRSTALEKERLLVGEAPCGMAERLGPNALPLVGTHLAASPRAVTRRSMADREASSVVQTRSAGPSSLA